LPRRGAHHFGTARVSMRAPPSRGGARGAHAYSASGTLTLAWDFSDPWSRATSSFDTCDPALVRLPMSSSLRRLGSRRRLEVPKSAPFVPRTLPPLPPQRTKSRAQRERAAKEYWDSLTEAQEVWALRKVGCFKIGEVR
jgi:hypothetical protein